jgi:type II secretory pathway component PulK
MKSQRLGFASLTAIVLMGLISMTLTALCVTLNGESRRTLAFAQDTQLRQLLFAGATIARGRLASNSANGPMSVTLVDSLHEQGAALTLDYHPGQLPNEQIVQIDASLPHRRLSQEIHFVRHDGIWQIASATLQ